MLIRELTFADRAILTRMIARDVEHSAGGMTPDFFYRSTDGAYGGGAVLCYSLCFEDAEGPVFYVRFDVMPGSGVHYEAPVFTPSAPNPKLEAAIRLHMQFDESIPLRTVRLLTTGWPVVKERCQMAGAQRLIFDSMNAGLRHFCQHRFGFRRIPGTADLELDISPENQGLGISGQGPGAS